jgi:DNA-binding GntR family transcriptional regulator
MSSPKRDPDVVILEAVPRLTLSDSVYEQLLEAIVTGRLGEGEEVNQVTVAGQLGVSRLPVREALRRLQAEQLVVAAPFQRYIVRRLSIDEVLELVDIREELEVFAARRAVTATATDPDYRRRLLDNLEDALLRFEEGDVDEWVRRDREFHHVLNSVSGMADKFIEALRLRINRYLRRTAADENRRRMVVREHRGIIRAVASGDADKAEALIRKHVRGTRAMIADMMTEGSGAPAPRKGRVKPAATTPADAARAGSSR